MTVDDRDRRVPYHETLDYLVIQKYRLELQRDRWGPLSIGNPPTPGWYDRWRADAEEIGLRIEHRLKELRARAYLTMDADQEAGTTSRGSGGEG